MTRTQLTHDTIKWLTLHAPKPVRENVEARDEWCDHLEHTYVQIKHGEEGIEATIPKPLTIFNSLYHVPQMRPDFTDPSIWVWRSKAKCWTKEFYNEKGYVHDPEPSRMWSYTDPGDVRIGRTDFAYLEIKDGERTYYELTDENRRYNPRPTHIKGEWVTPRFEYKVTTLNLLTSDNAMIDYTSRDGWELVSVVNDGKLLRYYWKRPV